MLRSRLLAIPIICALLVVSVAGSCLAEIQKKRVFAYYQVSATDRSADASLAACKDVITHVSPTIIEIMDAKGRIEVTPETKYLDTLRGDETTAIVPLIRNYRFDAKLARWALLSPTAQRRMVESILEILEKEPRYGGLVVDIENVWLRDRPFYTEFIERLADALHPKGYKLYTAVGPKDTDLPKPGWVRTAFDYEALGKHVDGLLLMTYNLHWRTGPPGPVAPLDWVEGCVKYAMACMPPDKVIVGIPFYGYDWPEGKHATSLTHKKASALIERVKPDIQWHQASATPWFTYTEKRVKHEVWFEDIRSIQAKLDMCRRLGIGGVAIWRLGDEDPRFWEAIRRYSSGGGQLPPRR